MILNRFKLDGKVAFVTGSGRGIGLEIARALGQAGARVVISDLRVDSSEAAASLLAQEGIEAISIPLDVTDSAAANSVAGRVIDRLGRVDILVNNAGVGCLNRSLDISDDEWRRMIEINTNSVFWCSRAFGRHMIQCGAGSIVNIGSMSGIIINRSFLAAHYMASKAGVHQITKALAVEWAEHNVRVNAVAPGYTMTDQTQGIRDDRQIHEMNIDMTPMKRFADPREIASAVLFLASDAASYCTGSVLTVDGGYTCW
ncbi:SDR family oxidoreductase (plasmid) [Lichenicola cladoniae]|uniref:SDR family oxidoreductase n=1 Tax=Lichenicola cladoniae TaxID=1484109 RepID=A0A6M8HZC3_9PROT|nr:glucose 1-dehydrogenase [Lichenicola cladoniae]NPD69302.1 SDR family oxidoreductase [Acetobacteraceae bacterium]QKE93889.1 SDR family oxidoreductase [Lichenicola cladoniae]